MRTHSEIKAAILANNLAGRHSFEGLTTDEIAAWHRRLMFGENNEAAPSAEEWAAIVN